jgi:sugar lactone lactonase YvrE
MKKPGLPIVLALGLGWQGQAGLWGQNAAARFISREVKPEVRAEGGAILSRPVALVCDEERLYILDMDGADIKVYSKSGEFERVIGRKGQGPGEFHLPSGLDILGGKLYVADSANRRVQVLDMKGKYLSGFRVPFQPHRVLALAPDRIVVMSLPTGRDGREKVLHGYDGAGQPLWEAVDSFFSGDSVYDLMRNRWFMLKAGGGEFFIARATDDRAVRRLDKDGTLLAEVEISEQNPFQDIEIPVREGKKRPLRALFWNCAADKERLYLLIPERTEDGDLGPGRKVVRVGPSGEVAAEIDLPEKLSRIAVEGKTIFGTDLDARLRVFVMVPR